LVAHGTRMYFDDFDLLMSNFAEVRRRINQRWRRNASTGLEVILKRLATIGLGTSGQVIAAASAQLDTLKASKGLMSSDHSHACALADTLSRLDALKGDLSRRAFRLGHLRPVPLAFEGAAREHQKVLDQPSVEKEYRNSKDERSQREKHGQA
jgi:hypothetical protein